MAGDFGGHRADPPGVSSSRWQSPLLDGSLANELPVDGPAGLPAPHAPGDEAAPGGSHAPGAGGAAGADGSVPPAESQSRRLLSELRRRRVFRAAGAYLAGAFVVLQGADYLFRALLFPDWAFRVVVLLAAVGFLLAVPLAWVFAIGPGGVRRTPALAADDAMLAAATADGRSASGSLRPAVVAAVALVLAAAGAGWLVLRHRGTAIHARRLVVVPFENRTGDAALAPLGDMAADWITEGLTESGVVEVADGSTALALSRRATAEAGMAPGDLVRLFSRETGAALVVTGRYYSERDSVELVAQVVDARSGKLLRVVGPVAAARAAPAEGAERLRARLLAELAVMLDDRLARYQPLDSHPPTYEAYREYLEGVRASVVDDFVEADARFSRAFALDTTFHRALMSAAHAAMIYGNWPRYDSLALRLERLRDQLSPVDRAVVEWQHAYRAQDRRAMYAAARRVVELAPGSDLYVWEAALAAGRVHRYRESLAWLRKLDPGRALTPKWYWAYVAGAQHALGDFDGELRSAAELARRQPASPVPDALRLSALAALGRTAEARTLAAALGERLAGDTVGAHELGYAEPLGYQAPTGASAFLIAARELQAHGHAADGRSVAAEGLRWSAGRPPAQRADDYWDRWVRAQLLGQTGRWREADALLAAPSPTYLQPVFDWYRAITAASLGAPERARAIARRLSYPDASLADYMYVSVAAALGDRAQARARLRDMQAAGGLYGEWWLHTDPTLVSYFGEPDLRPLVHPED